MPVEAVRAEAEAGSGPTTVPFLGETLDVIPVGLWRKSALRELELGHFDAWAEKCLTPDSLAVWDKYDPTVDEIKAFYAAWGEASGQDVGKFSASLRSSKNTARR